MKIEYRGINEEERRYHREAWIIYDDNKKAEIEKADKICEMLKFCGWNVYHEYGWIVVRVDDREDYKELVKVYKKLKMDFERDLE